MMSLAGIFLIVFLLVHMGINLPMRRRHGIVYPLNINGADLQKPVFFKTQKCASYENIFHGHGDAENSYR